MSANFPQYVQKNLKVNLSVQSRMEKDFIPFNDFFEKGKDPMFIIELNSLQFLQVNTQFEKRKSDFEKSLSLFEFFVKENDIVHSIQFDQQSATYLYVPIFRNNNKVLIQIVKLKSENNTKEEVIETNLSSGQSIKMAFLDKLPSGIVHTNQNFESIWFNAKFKSLFNRQISPGFNFIDAIYVKNISDFWQQMNKIKEDGGFVKFSFGIHNLNDSEEIFINATAFAVEAADYSEDGFIFILEDKTENIHFSEEITKQNLALNQINHELDKFLYSVSHNIRGPVASLEGLLKVIEISDVQAVNELKHHLRLNLRLLGGFVNDISNVATNIHTHVNFVDINIHSLMEQTLLFMDNIFGIETETTLNICNDCIIKTDTDRLGIIIKCLLKNSFQYRDRGKDILKIEIKVSQSEDFHLIEITDNGIGISNKVKPYIFDMFYRGTELSNGNGMGLYNSREILKKIGGSMNIESKEWEWTKAKIYLPMTRLK